MKYHQFLIAEGTWVIGVNDLGNHALHVNYAPTPYWVTYLPAARPPLAMPGDRIYDCQERQLGIVRGVYWGHGEYRYRIGLYMDYAESRIIRLCS